MKNHIMWLDPGLTTGAAWYDLEGNHFGSWQYDEHDLARRLEEVSSLYPGDLAVGYEQYIVTSGGIRQSSPEHALAVIGIVRDMAAQGMFELLTPRPPSARKLGSPVLLRRMGWYRPGQRHANDAAMHLLAHLLRMRPMPRAIRSTLFPGYDGGVTITA